MLSRVTGENSIVMLCINVGNTIVLVLIAVVKRSAIMLIGCTDGGIAKSK
jgi:nitrogen fixation/metabolism regulation signal transduction histidine kinase